MSRYWFIRAEQATYPVTLLCRVLGVAARAQADEELTVEIAAAYARSRQTYGAPRVHAALRAGGVRRARKRVARLMRAAGLVGCHRRRRARTTVADPAHAPAPDLVKRDFAAPAPDRLWIGDSTDGATWRGWLYLTVLLDVHSRRVVGWALAEHLRAAPSSEALTMARQRRRPAAGLVRHTDRGCQDAAAYQEALAARGIAVSMSRAGECLDNAMVESFFATLKAEFGDAHVWPSRAAARTAILAWLEGRYNRQRRHAALDYQAPGAWEEAVVVQERAA